MNRARVQRWGAIGLILVLGGCAIDDTPAPSGPRPSAGSTAQQQSPSATELPTPTFVPGGAARSGPQTIRLSDEVWTGSYRRSNGPSMYGGRTATWIYGTGTQYSAMQAEFSVAGQPGGTARLTIEGMDSEDRAKTPIRITINDVEIFSGPNPLPNDDQPIESGTWASHEWAFDASALRTGSNTIRIETLSPGQFSRPPFFMLDYAEIAVESR